jgi:hypothetical protein
MGSKCAVLPPPAAFERAAHIGHGRYGVVRARSHTPYARVDAMVAISSIAAAAAAAAGGGVALGTILTNCGSKCMQVTRPPDAKLNAKKTHEQQACKGW